MLLLYISVQTVQYTFIVSVLLAQFFPSTVRVEVVEVEEWGRHLRDANHARIAERNAKAEANSSAAAVFGSEQCCRRNIDSFLLRDYLGMHTP